MAGYWSEVHKDVDGLTMSVDHEILDFLSAIWLKKRLKKIKEAT